jgi:hypothetical protein
MKALCNHSVARWRVEKLHDRLTYRSSATKYSGSAREMNGSIAAARLDLPQANSMPSLYL